MMTVGGTERMASRAARVLTSSGTAGTTSTAAKTKPNSSHSMYNNGAANGNTSQAATIKRNPPKLNEKGHLLPEEVVRRTSSAIKTKEVLLGEPDNPIQVEVSYVELCDGQDKSP
jgi:hypothetical protein